MKIEIETEKLVGLTQGAVNCGVQLAISLLERILSELKEVYPCDDKELVEGFAKQFEGIKVVMDDETNQTDN